jgi:hypothetical protein
MSDMSQLDTADGNSVESDKEVKSSDIASYIGIAESTVRKYSQILEKAGYQFRKDTSGARIFTKKDLQVFSDMIKIKEKAGIGLEQAALVAVTQNDVTIQPTQSVQTLIDQRSNEVMAATIQKMNSMFEVIQGLQEQVSTLQVSQREERMIEYITLRRIESRLRDEALTLWEQKPEEERFIKRWFRKEENIEKKNYFVSRYIDQNLEKNIKNELNQ